MEILIGLLILIALLSLAIRYPVLLLVAVFLGLGILSGCQGQTNQEIILATKECEEAGLRAVMLCNVANDCRIQCRPRDEKD